MFIYKYLYMSVSISKNNAIHHEGNTVQAWHWVIRGNDVDGNRDKILPVLMHSISDIWLKDKSNEYVSRWSVTCKVTVKLQWDLEVTMVHCFRKKSSFLHNQSWHTCEIFRFCIVLFLVRWFCEKWIWCVLIPINNEAQGPWQLVQHDTCYPEKWWCRCMIRSMIVMRYMSTRKPALIGSSLF